MDKLTILIVDDAAPIRLLIQQTLEDFEDHGVTIITAANGQEALKLSTQYNPRLIILDVMMPVMDGFEVCECIKSNQQQDSFIILLTAKGQECDQQKGIEKGADLYMTKPFDPGEVVSIAEKVLGITI